MTVLLTNVFNEATAETDRIRNQLSRIDVAMLAYKPQERELAARQVASSYVWLAAALEAYLERTLEAVYLEINASGILYSQLCLRLFSVVCANEFVSLQDLRNIKLWHRRIEIFSRLDDSSPVSIPTNVVPLDGRTIRPHHLEVIWQVFGFPGDSMIDPRHRFALNDLADGRNAVAHGEINPGRFGRSKHIPGVIRMTNYIDEIILHITTTAEGYLVNYEYKR